MKPHLSALIRASAPKATERVILRTALAQPWCWPVDSELASLVREHLDLRPPPEPNTGETLLVAISSTQRRASLWKLSVRDTGANRVAVSDETRQAFELAVRLSTTNLPLVYSVRALERRTPCHISHIHKVGLGRDDRLEGASFGLSMFLALASRMLKSPLTPRLAASAVLNSDGTLGAVEGLETKLVMIGRNALGVRRVLVASTQGSLARQFADKHGLDLEIEDVADLRKALSLAFPLLAGQRPPDWAGAEAGIEATEALYAAAIRGNNRVLAWGGIEKSSAVLKGATGDPVTRLRAGVTHRIARRHLGRSDESIVIEPHPELMATMYLPERLKFLAHVVQSHTDHVSPTLRRVVEETFAEVADARDCCLDGLRVRGAIARGWSMLREYERSLEVLGPTVEAWIAAKRMGDVSHALSEMIRVVGILRRGDELEALRSTLDAFRIDARVAPMSLVFVELALGRAYHNMGDPEAALAALDGTGPAWEWARNDVLQARQSVQAAALRAMGDTTRAAEAAEGLEEIWRLLSALDAAVTDADLDALRPLLEVLEGLKPRIVGSLTGDCETDLERAGRLLREYPY